MPKAQTKEPKEITVSTHIRRVWKRRKDGVKQRYRVSIKSYKQKRVIKIERYHEEYAKAKTTKNLGEKVEFF
jgi:hypothetical protein